MVINNFDLMSITILPAKTDPPLLVDSDAPLAAAITLQGFQAIARWHEQRPQVDRGIEHTEFAASQPLNILRQSPRKPAVPNGLGFLVAEATNH